MPLALLIALAVAIALGVYALRVAGERNRLEREVEELRGRGVTIVYGGPDLHGPTDRQQVLAAKRIVDKAKRKARK